MTEITQQNSGDGLDAALRQHLDALREEKPHICWNLRDDGEEVCIREAGHADPCFAPAGEHERLDDAIRDMLDFTVGWCRPSMTDAEKLEAIRKIGEKALEGSGSDV